MDIIAYISLLFMGITLGLIGSGGSILTIPILVYLLNIPILIATTYSLIIVGLTSLIGTIRYRGDIQFKDTLLFLIPSISGVFIARYFIISNLPPIFLGLPIEKVLIILLLFFMYFSAYIMIRKPHIQTQELASKSIIKLISTGFILGIITGILGAGGGFLIIPTLMFFMGFTINKAIPSSLFIITVNSLIGFYADQNTLSFSDYMNLSKYLAAAFSGVLIGLYVSKFIKNDILKKMFGYMILSVVIAITLKEFIL